MGSYPMTAADYQRRYRERHPEYKDRENTRRRVAYKANPIKVKALNQKYYRNNVYKFLARNTRRRELIKQRTPLWACLASIQEVYKSCPKGFHVDHIIPLRGREVCGLHVANNLQILPAQLNLVKGNCLWHPDT